MASVPSMASEPSTALSSTLRHVAETKLEKLEKRRAELDAFWKEYLDEKTAEFRNVDSVRRLLQGMQDHGHKFQDDAWPKNLHVFLDLAEKDPVLRPSHVAAWGRSLVLELEQKRARYEMTELFSKLVLQWIQSSSSVPPAQSDSTSGLSELEQQRQTWGSYAFTACETDKPAILAYLDGLFFKDDSQSVSKKSPMETLRSSIAHFDDISIDKDKVRMAIQALLKEDLFMGEKRAALEDMQSRDMVMDEIADALRSDLSALHSLRWHDRPIPVHFRKHINGRFRVYLEEEIYRAIFVQIVGTHWAVFLKNALSKFVASSAWRQKPATTRMSKEHMEKRIQFVGSSRDASRRKNSINASRWKSYQDVFFLSQLPSSLQQGTKGYYGEDLGTQTKSAPRATPQRLLRLITTEILLHKHLYGTATYFQTDFKWFGPSIPHSTLLALFEFFHVPPKWVAFFRAFMQPTLCVSEQESDAEPKKRKRGIPISHTLSTVFGELLLFVLDFAVNQETQGCYLYRLFDDLHFWGQPDSCVAAWNTIQTFSRIMGLELNEEKSGSFHCSLPGQEVARPSALPANPVHWGFLTLVGGGEWQLDQERLERHIREMARQLAYCDSVLSFIHAYNTYMRFFLNNAGHSAACLGKKHAMTLIDMVLQVQRTVMETLSDSRHSDVVSFLREKIQKNEDLLLAPLDLSDAFFFFPTYLGGLDVLNPLEGLIEDARHSGKDPESIILAAREKEKEAYRQDWEKFEAGLVPDHTSGGSTEPLTLEEYVQYPEDGSRIWQKAYEELQQGTDAFPSMDLTREWDPAVSRLRQEDETIMESEHAWLAQLYGAEVVSRMGRLAFGERDLMPIGLVKVLRKERARWQA
ncbi:hypothetical protein MNAN1_003487 [Malassezia nana]|uniref:Reverse transcriptase domain-containing protein n=1 Tax=Malassezia nana TaxID=180528 RepID=A0AAF0J3S4_9BASI|nr:hypothetical protein MNAN1_003487 [Malassezia nana]